MKEEPRRLAPTPETVRELYLRSGNNCAFPGCVRRLIDNDGNVVGQICHIEDAMPGGRFNPGQTNEDRRDPSNLMMMCYDHHVATKDPSKFSVATLKKMKLDHESKFSDAILQQLDTVTDHSKLERPTRAQNLRRMARVLGWSLSTAELNESLKDVCDLQDRLSDLPKPTRQFFEVVLSRATKSSMWRMATTGLEVQAEEIRQAVNMSAEDARKYFAILDNKGFVCDNDKDDMGMQLVGILNLAGGSWPFWNDLKAFCKKEGFSLAQFVIALDFALLDE
jgi:hypothetical protein